MVICPETKSYKKLLRELGMFNSENRRLRGDMAEPSKYLTRLSDERQKDSKPMDSNYKKNEFGLYIRKNVLTRSAA